MIVEVMEHWWGRKGKTKENKAKTNGEQNKRKARGKRKEEG